ncbi:MAG: hypothetical protein RR865_10320 [Clostridia bacterium]
MTRNQNRVLSAVPTALSVSMGCVLVGILGLLLFAQGAYAFAYQNRSLLSNLALLPIAAVGIAALLWGSAGRKHAASHGRRPWLLRGYFLVLLAVQLLVARSIWFYCGWDVENIYHGADILARGQVFTNGDYYRLCPNNAPITVLLAIPLWVGVRLGLAVPYAILPYLGALMLNVTCYLCVACARRYTKSPLAHGFALGLSTAWIALSPYMMVPYTDTYAVLFPILALYVYGSKLRSFPKWMLIAFLCFFGASMKPTVLIFLIALAALGVARFFARREYSPAVFGRAGLIVLALLLGAIPAKLWQSGTTAYLAGSAKPQEQLSATHYLMLGMNAETYGGHSPEDVAFSQSFPTLEARKEANLERAWERFTQKSPREALHFFSVKAYKAYADGAFAANGSLLELEIPKRTDQLSTFLRAIYHTKGSLNPLYSTIMQCLWLGALALCAFAMLAQRKNPMTALLSLTLLGLTLYLLLFEVWPRYLFLYAPFFVLLASMGMEELNRVIHKKSAS